MGYVLIVLTTVIACLVFFTKIGRGPYSLLLFVSLLLSVAFLMRYYAFPDSPFWVPIALGIPIGAAYWSQYVRRGGGR